MILHKSTELPVDPKFDLKFHMKDIEYPFVEKDLIALFALINDTPCLMRSYSQVNTDKVLKWLEELGVSKKNTYIRSKVSPLDRTPFRYKWFAWLQKDLLIYAWDTYLLIYYSGQVPASLMQNLYGFIESNFQKEDFINCVYYFDDFFNGNCKPLRLSNKFIDLAVHYNDDMKSFHQKITDHLQPDDAEGLIILAGEPGNGQSTYLHYLTRVVNRRFLYLSQWGGPTLFLDYLDYNEYKRPLLILEDADTYVKHPGVKAQSLGQYVKDLLKGRIKKKFKNLPVIITLNQPFSSFPELNACDSPYIIAKYEFRPLETEKARALSTSLGRSAEITGPLSLHEIYHES